jgi:hypothetical protein
MPPSGILFSIFFTFTPIPWAAILCLVLYRYDLSRLFHPLKDRSSTKDWRRVLDDLGIARDGSLTYGKTDRKRRSYFSIQRFWSGIIERNPDVGFYLSVLVIVTSISLFSSLIIRPVLMGMDPLLYSRFGFMISTGFQFVSALPSVFLMQRFLGPFPSPPFRFHLKKNRLGSLLIYEADLNLKSSELTRRSLMPSSPRTELLLRSRQEDLSST